jgi:hypothetical protein
MGGGLEEESELQKIPKTNYSGSHFSLAPPSNISQNEKMKESKGKTLNVQACSWFLDSLLKLNPKIN